MKIILIKEQFMREVLLDTLLDTLKAAPILFVVYGIMEYLESRVNTSRIFGGKLEKFGPLIGAGACGSRPL